MRAALLPLLVLAGTARPDPHPLLAGKAIGVLVQPDERPYGRFFEPGFDWAWAGSEDRTVRRFLVNEAEYAPYFVPASAPVNAFNLFVELPEGRTTYAVEMDGRHWEDAARAQGVKSSVLLAEVEVNGGRGGRGTHFVITKTRIIEDLDEKLGDVREMFDAELKRNRKAIGAELANAEEKMRKAAGARFLRKNEGTTEMVVFRPTWNAEAKRVEVAYAYRKVGSAIVKSPPPNPYSKSGAMDPPPELTARFSAGMAIRYALEGREAKKLETWGPMILEPAIGSHNAPWQPMP